MVFLQSGHPQVILLVLLHPRLPLNHHYLVHSLAVLFSLKQNNQMNRFKGMRTIAAKVNLAPLVMMARSTSLLCFSKKWCMKRLGVRPSHSPRGQEECGPGCALSPRWSLRASTRTPTNSPAGSVEFSRSQKLMLRQHSRSISRPHTQQTTCGSSPTTPPIPLSRCCTTRTWRMET